MHTPAFHPASPLQRHVPSTIRFPRSPNLALAARRSRLLCNAASESGASETNPGDDAPPGTPGTGENLCRRCNGSGRDGASDCPECGGTGKVTVGIGGA